MAVFSTGEAFGRLTVPILIPLSLQYELISTPVEQTEIVHLAQHIKLACFEISKINTWREQKD